MDQQFMQHVFECLGATASDQLDIRSAAEAQLNEAMGRPGFFGGLFQIVNSDEVPGQVRQAGAIFFKNKLKNRWGDALTEEEKHLIRENMVESLIHTPPAVRRQLEVVMEEIIQVDFPHAYGSLVPKILNYLQSGDAGCTYGACLALFLLARVYEMRMEEKRGPFNEVVEATFPIVLDLLRSLGGTFTPEAGEVQRLILKTYWCSFQMTNPNYLVQRDVFMAWIEALTDVIERPVPADIIPQDSMEREKFIFFRVRRNALEIVGRYYSRYGNAGFVRDSLLEFAQFFASEIAPPVLEKYLGLLEQWSSGVYFTPREMNCIMHFVEDGVRQAKTFKIIKGKFEFLFTRCMFPLLCFNEEDAECWENDPHEFIHKTYNVLEDFYSPVSATINALLELVRLRAKSTLGPVVNFCYSILTAYSADPSVENTRAKDGALHCLGSIAEKLKATAAYQGNLEELFMVHIFPEFQNPAGFMRARACWTAMQFYDIEWTSEDNYRSVLMSVRATMRDPELIVRVFAANALRMVMKHEAAEALLRPILPELLSDYFDMMGEVDNDDIVTSLDTLIQIFGEEMAPLSYELTVRLIESFYRLVETEKQDEENMDAGLAAMNCLAAISTLVESLKSKPECYPPIEEALAPMMIRMCKQEEGVDFFEEILDLITKFTCYTTSISGHMWSVLPHLHEAFDQWAIDYFADMLPCIDNFISRGGDTLLQSPDLMNMVINMVHKPLSNVDIAESYCLTACKLSEVLIHNCPGRIDELVQGLIRLALDRLQHAQMWALRVLLFEIIANSLFYNPMLAVRTLEELGAVETVFRAYQDLGGRFSRMHDKKVCVLGLSSLFTLPMHELSAEMQACMKPTLENLLKELVSLVDQITQFQLMCMQEQSSSSEEWLDDDGIPEDEDQHSKADAKYLQTLQEKAAQFSALMGDHVDADLDEDVEYESPIDDINEVIFFMDAMQHFAGVQPEAYQALIGALDPSVHPLMNKVQQAAEQSERGAKQPTF